MVGIPEMNGQKSPINVGLQEPTFGMVGYGKI
jgi:hypothetical protein